ncbi:hypothetical protein [Pseudarthrobacter sp. BRE9]|uniref:hypothetical protein n=1 Tax=Pseudarthrobacter sp. BRE9 TaxID=2962582 RepID=UPI002881558A|nr:hypothetical protein [Pseudarthrobacter sp. BRE9]MDT0168436.1 hypothetical protein [Pseudarthrobacter sp. BRE9]
MAETFYGPWRIVLLNANSHFAQQMVIEGSDNADGGYDIAYGEALDVSVAGAQWRLRTEFFPFDGPAWLEGDTRAISRFEPGAGLLVQIDGASRPPGRGGPLTNLRLLCSCLDPETNPIPAPNPFDFTILDYG